MRMMRPRVQARDTERPRRCTSSGTGAPVRQTPVLGGTHRMRWRAALRMPAAPHPFGPPCRQALSLGTYVELRKPAQTLTRLHCGWRAANTCLHFALRGGRSDPARSAAKRAWWKPTRSLSATACATRDLQVNGELAFEGCRLEYRPSSGQHGGTAAACTRCTRPSPSMTSAKTPRAR
jgi:hypothetical protein